MALTKLLVLGGARSGKSRHAEGRVRAEGPGASLRADPALTQSYLGRGAG